jgi:CRISPR/Cas system-associated exonuclease Cas4 (RecB family)
MSLWAHAGHIFIHEVHKFLKDYEKKRPEEEERKQRAIKEAKKKYEWIWVSQQRRELAAKVIATIETEEQIPVEIYNKDPKYVENLLKEFNREDLVPENKKNEHVCFHLVLPVLISVK